MKQVFRFDATGVYLEPVILKDGEQTPKDCTEIQPPDGLFKGQFVNGAWVEGMVAADIKALKDASAKNLSDFDKLKKQHTDLMFQLMVKGVL